MPIKIPQTLADELVRLNIISTEDIATFLDLAQTENKDFGQILVEKAVVSDADLLAIKSRLYRLPTIDLEGYEFSREVLKEFSEEVVNFYKIAPFEKEGNVLKVAIINPEAIDALEALKFIAEDKKLALEKYLVSYGDFETVIKSYRTLSGEVGKALESLTEEESGKEGEEAGSIKSIEEITAEAPVSKIVAVLVKHAVESRASDIHIEPFEDRVRTRFRIDGILTTTLTLPKTLQSAVVTRIKILSDLKIDETRLAQDGRFSTKLGNRKIDFRVSTFPTKNGEKVVMRILDPLTGKVELSELGLDGRSAEVIEKAMGKTF